MSRRTTRKRALAETTTPIEEAGEASPLPAALPREAPPPPPPREFTPDSIGKRLNRARLELGLSVDEAAHATKMRPDKIIALESNDYGRFGNNAYAKGFLLMYGRFLRVDVADQARVLETAQDVRVDEYQYLSNAPAPTSERMARTQRPRKPSLVPLVVFVVCLVGGAFAFYLYVTFKRLGSLDQPARGGGSESLERAPAGVAEIPAVAPTTPAPLIAAAGAPPPAFSSEPQSQQAATIPGLPSVGTEAPVPEVRRAEAVPAVPAPPTLPQAPPLPVVNEIVIEPIKKTWITIARDHPNSPPIFMDYLYPNAGALKLRGTRFFIDARDPSAIQIRKNGIPIAYEAGAIIQ